MPGVVANVEIIVHRDDRFLTIVRSDDEEFGGGWLCFPGGKLDPGLAMDRALEATARRELQEEVGLDVGIDAIVYVESHTFLIGDETVLDIVMMTGEARGEPSVQDPAEVAEILWLPAEEIMTDPRVQPWTRASLQLALARLHRQR